MYYNNKPLFHCKLCLEHKIVYNLEAQIEEEVESFEVARWAQEGKVKHFGFEILNLSRNQCPLQREKGIKTRIESSCQSLIRVE
jgi:hypothetical protein